MKKSLLMVCVAPICLIFSGEVKAQSSAGAQPAEDVRAEGANDGQDIIVTAQKRSQSINDVPMSITAASGEQLTRLGIADTRDLGKLAPGFTFAETVVGVPVYSLRGVGFYDSSLASTPAVSVYGDEVPLTYPAMTRGAILDLERVEVLKGPQGTLFGQNATGGAINYVAAKPTDDLHYGGNFSFGRFSEIGAGGFISGPLSETVKARIAVQTTQRTEGWQKSLTRDDRLGKANKTIGRMLIDWQPTDALSIRLNLNGWIDKSETQAAQLVAFLPQNPANLPPETAASPFAEQNDRSADWNNAPRRPKRDEKFGQASVRADYDMGPATLTSVTAYSRLRAHSYYDSDGIVPHAFDYATNWKIDSVYQELRLSGKSRDLQWVVGANYQHDRVDQYDPFDVTSSSGNGGFGITYDGGGTLAYNKARTFAAFANVEYELTPTLTLQGGARYTNDRRKSKTCGFVSGTGTLGDVFEILSVIFRGGGVAPNIPVGTCYTLGADFLPAFGGGVLKQDNVSWRAGINWKPDRDLLLYANVSRGYKNGGFPAISATSTAALTPYNQESVLAYEAGFKASFADRRAHANGAIFYYDYKDKQVLGAYLDPVWAVLRRMINIPKSRIQGAELQVDAQPVDGLRLSGAVTYLDAKLTRYAGYDAIGRLGVYNGTRMPLTPKFNAVADAEYEVSVSEGLKAFVGGGLTYNSRTNAGIGTPAITYIKAFTLLDLRAGVRSADGRWVASAYGRNITNKYYWTTALQSQDGVVRYAGMPATYGLSLTYRY